MFLGFEKSVFGGSKTTFRGFEKSVFGVRKERLWGLKCVYICIYKIETLKSEIEELKAKRGHDRSGKFTSEINSEIKSKEQKLVELQQQVRKFD